MNNQNTKRRAYTDDDIKTIRQMRADGNTIQEVADKLNRNVGSVASVCDRMMIPYTKRRKNIKWTEDIKHKMAQLIIDGTSRSDVARMFNTSVVQVSIFMSEMRKQGIKVPYMNWGTYIRERRNRCKC